MQIVLLCFFFTYTYAIRHTTECNNWGFCFITPLTRRDNWSMIRRPTRSTQWRTYDLYSMGVWVTCIFTLITKNEVNSINIVTYWFWEEDEIVCMYVIAFNFVTTTEKMVENSRFMEFIEWTYHQALTDIRKWVVFFMKTLKNLFKWIQRFRSFALNSDYLCVSFCVRETGPYIYHFFFHSTYLQSRSCTTFSK